MLLQVQRVKTTQPELTHRIAFGQAAHNYVAHADARRAAEAIQALGLPEQVASASDFEVGEEVGAPPPTKRSRRSNVM